MNIAEPKVKAGYSLGLHGTRQGQVITWFYMALSLTITDTNSLSVCVDLNIICQLALREQPLVLNCYL